MRQAQGKGTIADVSQRQRAEEDSLLWYRLGKREIRERHRASSLSSLLPASASRPAFRFLSRHCDMNVESVHDRSEVGQGHRPLYFSVLRLASYP